MSSAKEAERADGLAGVLRGRSCLPMAVDHQCKAGMRLRTLRAAACNLGGGSGLGGTSVCAGRGPEAPTRRWRFSLTSWHRSRGCSTRCGRGSACGGQRLEEASDFEEDPAGHDWAMLADELEQDLSAAAASEFVSDGVAVAELVD